MKIEKVKKLVANLRDNKTSIKPWISFEKIPGSY